MEAILDTIDRLAATLTKMQPLKPEYQQRLDKKFRLEFNYNSNHIEGNTLTYGETELLLIFGKTTGNHELREYEEMKSHDVAFELIKDWAKDKERLLTEMAIKNIHEMLLVRPFWKEALTADGQPTRRLIKVGNYKEQPNSVRLQNGEMFHYTSPENTPIEMGELMSWYKDEEQKSELHPVTLAALLHYKFVRIHPFDDGNGRISRLMMNYVLLKHDLQPVVITSADKKNYLFALNQADVGNIDVFIEYIAEQVVWSLNIAIKAAKGENIEERTDWEKKVTLFKKNFDKSNERKQKRSIENIGSVIKNSVIPLFELMKTKFILFNDLFDAVEHRIIFTKNEQVKYNVQNRAGGLMLSTANFPKATYNWVDRKIKNNEMIHAFGFDYFFKGYKRGYPFNVNIFLNFKFDEYTYSIEVKSNIFDDEQFIENNYENAASEDTKAMVVLDIAKMIFKHLEENTQKLEP